MPGNSTNANPNQLAALNQLKAEALAAEAAAKGASEAAADEARAKRREAVAAHNMAALVDELIALLNA